MGRVAIGRQGLDVTPTDKWGTASVEGKRHLVQREVRTMEEEARMVKAARKLVKLQGRSKINEAWMERYIEDGTI